MEVSFFRVEISPHLLSHKADKEWKHHENN